jgi:Cu+-exporting ATPase
MDSLIAIGSSAATIYGIFAIYRINLGLATNDLVLVSKYAHDLYFESAAMIPTLITFGKYLEAKSKGQTSKAIEKLINLQPKTALVAKDGKEVIVQVSDLVIGDEIIVKPGETIPVDGIILEGTTSINESTITGESIPIEKQKGDKVISATTNQAGSFKFKATRVGENTTIKQIIKLVDEANSSKAPIAKMANYVSGIFVPIVLGIALIATSYWLLVGATFEFALSIGIAILVISCPCALGLATPVAIMVGTGLGAENGILIKSGSALETLPKIDTIVLDKTGTITKGDPVVTDIITKDFTEKEVLAIVLSLETKSNHPLAKAIIKYTQNKNIETLAVTDFKALFGQGLKGIINNQTYYLGNSSLMKEEAIDLTFFKEDINKLTNEGKTPLILAKNKEIIAILAVSDLEKTTSKKAIEEFQKLGLNVIMLTGDNLKTAQALKNKLNIPEIIAEVLPEDKEQEIIKLQAKGKKVAMIGDGINDSIALTRANVGIAIGSGSDIAIESADIILMKDSLLDAVNAIHLSKEVIKNIKQNIFWAFFYNVIGIPLAAGILYPSFGLKLSPIVGAAAMSLSSVFVVTNALRLKNFKAITTTKKEVAKNKKSLKTNNKIELAGCQLNRNHLDKETFERITKASSYKKTNLVKKREDKKTMQTKLKIEGMMCDHCKMTVEKRLKEIPGVDSVVVDLASKTATVTTSEKINPETYNTVITNAGYELIK